LIIPVNPDTLLTILRHTIDQTHVRSVNQRVILDHIFQNGKVSRAELSRMVQISKSAITENINGLLQAGIIREAGVGNAASSGGRRPIMLQFNSSYQYLIAIDFNGEDAFFVLFNLQGEIQNQFTMRITEDVSYLMRQDLVKKAIDMLLSSANLEKSILSTVAISTPGVYHPETGMYLTNPQFQNWHIDKLSQAVTEAFNVPTLIVNDVNAAALGEHYYGAGINSSNILYISCGQGLGAGLILNNQLFTGNRGNAGEIASFLLGRNLGESDNLEASLHINHLLGRIRQEAPGETWGRLGVSPEELEFSHILDHWEKDPFIFSCIQESSEILGVTISNLVSLLDCDLVIVGGEYQAFSRVMLPIINDIVGKKAFTPVRTVESKLGKSSGVYGLFSLVKDGIFKDLCT
jgi:predicted NBD/HSP70 family sugar kinase